MNFFSVYTLYMPFVQNAIGRGIGITDYRGSCAVNAHTRYDFGINDEGAYRKFAQENAVKIRDNHLAYIPQYTYFGTGCNFTNTNPSPTPNPYYGR